MAFTHTKKVDSDHLLRPGSGSGSGRPDPDPTKKVRIRIRDTVYSTVWLEDSAT
jgi:hypothetical protein